MDPAALVAAATARMAKYASVPEVDCTDLPAVAASAADAKKGSSRRTQCGASVGHSATPVGGRDGVRFTLRYESGVGLAIVAHHNGTLAEMNYLDDMRMTRGRNRMMVIPPVYCLCRARFNESRTLFRRIPGHGPSPPPRLSTPTPDQPCTHPAFAGAGLAGTAPFDVTASSVWPEGVDRPAEPGPRRTESRPRPTCRSSRAREKRGRYKLARSGRGATQSLGRRGRLLAHGARLPSGRTAYQLPPFRNTSWHFTSCLPSCA